MKTSRISSNYNRKDYVDPCGGSIMSWLCWDISLSGTTGLRVLTYVHDGYTEVTTR